MKNKSMIEHPSDDNIRLSLILDMSKKIDEIYRTMPKEQVEPLHEELNPHEIHYISQELYRLGVMIDRNLVEKESAMNLKKYSKTLYKFAYQYQMVEEDMDTSKRLIRDINKLISESSDGDIINPLNKILYEYQKGIKP